jgi:hypothetical protein
MVLADEIRVLARLESAFFTSWLVWQIILCVNVHIKVTTGISIDTCCQINDGNIPVSLRGRNGARGAPHVVSITVNVVIEEGIISGTVDSSCICMVVISTPYSLADFLIVSFSMVIISRTTVVIVSIIVSVVVAISIAIVSIRVTIAIVSVPVVVTVIIVSIFVVVTATVVSVSVVLAATITAFSIVTTVVVLVFTTSRQIPSLPATLMTIVVPSRDVSILVIMVVISLLSVPIVTVFVSAAAPHSVLDAGTIVSSHITDISTEARV